MVTQDQWTEEQKKLKRRAEFLAREKRIIEHEVLRYTHGLTETQTQAVVNIAYTAYEMGINTGKAIEKGLV